jgi:hypothetical protein
MCRILSYVRKQSVPNQKNCFPKKAICKKRNIFPNCFRPSEVDWQDAQKWKRTQVLVRFGLPRPIVTGPSDYSEQRSHWFGLADGWIAIVDRIWLTSQPAATLLSFRAVPIPWRKMLVYVGTYVCTYVPAYKCTYICIMKYFRLAQI